MKLSNKCLSLLQANRNSILMLALALGFTELWINKLLDANKKNGPLTTATALQVIREETGLTDQEILDEATEKEKVK